MPTRILHVVADAQVGGAQWYLVELARVQRERGQRVTIVTGGAGPLWSNYRDVADDAIRSTVLQRSIGLNDLAASREVARLARQHDITHAHASKALLVSAIAAAPFVWSAH